ncbi:HK97 gp10 family phage protein (plasmid) [Streptomyces sp. NBC_01723]|uniref:HK97 gp10 family phage protein n=1 Tax=Streptomyces sp. NBC_01723 TaxID=2975921 RepID=UPI002E2F0184|nr:HK97 gp10 family phage protein [Streptomyces sp. NBC_01723]
MDLDDLPGRLEQAADRVGPEVNRAVKQQGRLLLAMIKFNASGRPGPNIITGDYFDSWKPEPFPVPDGGGMDIGTTEPQGKRLEYGFMYRYDSLGRFYRQPPFPHVGPAVADIEQDMLDPFKAACDRIFGSA